MRAAPQPEKRVHVNIKPTHEGTTPCTYVQLVERRQSDDDRRVRALRLHVPYESREAPEHIQERDRRAQRAARAAQEDVRVELRGHTLGESETGLERGSTHRIQVPTCNHARQRHPYDGHDAPW